MPPGDAGLNIPETPRKRCKARSDHNIEVVITDEPDNLDNTMDN